MDKNPSSERPPDSNGDDSLDGVTADALDGAQVARPEDPSRPPTEVNGQLPGGRDRVQGPALVSSRSPPPLPPSICHVES